MTVTIVYIHVKEHHIEEFKSATQANHRASVEEPGNLRFDFLQNENDPSQFILYEAYESTEAAAAHKKTPHYLNWRETVQNWMSEPREGVKYKVLNLKK